MRYAFALLLAAHAVAHLVGFVVSWRLATFDEMPYATTILAGRIDLGDGGIRIAGALWLMTAAAFMAAAVMVAAGQPHAWEITALATTLSIVMCIAGWPDARIGLAVNGMLVLLLAASQPLKLIHAT